MKQQNFLKEIPNGAIPVLDYGFVGLIDQMGTDQAIVQAARVSYGKGTKTPSEDEKLIHYLYKNRHTTPFEMVEFKFICRMPIFVARQWVRHRMASINEYSGRYSEMSDNMYLPPLERIQTQDDKNKQVSSGEQIKNAKKAEEVMIQAYEDAFQSYQRLLEFGVARELARVVLPVANYTEWYWKVDLHNLFNFLRLRMDSHAQFEIREYAYAMAELIIPHVPIAWAAFNRYKFECVDTEIYEPNVEDVKALRESTGANISDCKKVLILSKGDMKIAYLALRMCGTRGITTLEGAVSQVKIEEGKAN